MWISTQKQGNEIIRICYKYKFMNERVCLILLLATTYLGWSLSSLILYYSSIIIRNVLIHQTKQVILITNKVMFNCSIFFLLLWNLQPLRRLEWVFSHHTFLCSVKNSHLDWFIYQHPNCFDTSLVSKLWPQNFLTWFRFYFWNWI